MNKKIGKGKWNGAHADVCDLFCRLVGLKGTVGASRLEPNASAKLLGMLLHSWQVLPALTPRQLDALDKVLAGGDARTLRAAQAGISAWAKAQSAGHDDFFAELDARGVGYVLLKGAASARTLYRKTWQRTGWDLDIGVSRNRLGPAYRAALSAGFLAAQQPKNSIHFIRADPVQRERVEKKHYELGFLVRRQHVKGLGGKTLSAIREAEFCKRYWFDDGSGPLWCYVAVDVHHAISLDIPLKELVAESRTITRDGKIFRVPSRPWGAFHLIFKIYWEGVAAYGKGLYQYADLVRLVRDMPEPEIRRLAGLLNQYRLDAAGYHVLCRLPAFGLPLSPALDRYIESARLPPAGRSPERLNDRGDMWWKLFGKRGPRCST